MKTRKQNVKTLRNINLLEDEVFKIAGEIAKIVNDERNKFLTYILQSAAGISINQDGIKQKMLPSGLYRNKYVFIFISMC